MSTIPLLLKASSSQCTKIVGKSINPHYNATMHFTGVTNDIMLSTSIHAIIFGKSTQFSFDISLIMHFDKLLRILFSKILTVTLSSCYCIHLDYYLRCTTLEF